MRTHGPNVSSWQPLRRHLNPAHRFRTVRALALQLQIACLLLAAWAALFSPAVSGAETVLVPSGAVWKYLDNGSDQSTAWRGTFFDDSSWRSGPAQLGYGDGDESTTVGFGTDPNNKFITTYFRRTFSVPDPSVFAALTLRLLRDDGAVVYLNGTEVFRSNLPSGTIGFTTPAVTALGGTDESTFVQSGVNPALLLSGANTLAIEIHQANGSSSDISFDLQLIASDAVPTTTLTRGPYLQSGTPSRITVKWRTSSATDSTVRYGTTLGDLNLRVDDAAATTEHEVKLNGLSPSTKYFYSLGTSAGSLAGNDPDHFFVTSPPNGTAVPTRIWVLGDSGTANLNAAAVRNAYLNFTGTTHTNLWLMLGDNAYDNGTDAEYQAAVFNLYPTILRKSVLWSTIGNHDTAQSASPPGSLPYYSIFTLPTAGEAGGIASGTEDYYSFDYGNIHFICLDSMTSDRSPAGAMMTWLRSDLESTAQEWIIAFWHHPPYSKGSHNSDTELQLVEMRQNALPILEAGGVDLVLCGHSHSYERSYLIDGHYGNSSTFIDAMKKNGGSGRIDAGGAYSKPTLAPAANQGAVYAVAGSSGQISGGLLNHPAMFISLNALGSMVIDINGNRLDAKFLLSSGAIGDYFTVVKGGAPDAPSALTASAISASTIDLAWLDNSIEEQGFHIEQSTNGGPFNRVATVNANVTAHSVTGLSASTPYSFRVLAFNSAGDSAYSNIASATTRQEAPAAPGNLTATAFSRKRIDLAWRDNSTNEDGFKIERSRDGITFSQIATPAKDETTYSDTGLRAKRTYHYRVRAFNSAGDSPFSNVATTQTLAPAR